MARAAPHRFVFDFTRAVSADALTVELAEGDHDYQLRAAGQSRPDIATLRWSARLRENLAALRDHAEAGVSEVAARVGRTLADFVHVPGQAAALAQVAARAGAEPVALTVRSNAAEIYLLPWELLTLEGVAHAGSLARLLIRYEWPDSKTAAPLPGLSMTARGRVVFAWSAAGGKVDAARHVRLIEKAIDAGAGSFEDRGRALDVIENASCESLHGCLERAKAAREPVGVLHLLCHGGVDRQGAYGLVLNDGDDPTAPDLVSPSRLQQLLAPYAGLVRLVVISACDGGNAGDVGDALGSVAQGLHRAGFPVVLASRFPLSWDGARAFAAELYDQLLRELASAEDAFLAARAKLSRRASFDWASLQLYAREADGDAHHVLHARPYRGLAAFTAEHARFFFGREAEVEELCADLDRLCAEGRPRFMVVSGASGTGKSSLVMAGAIPRWARTTPDGRFDHVVIRPGASPDEALARAAGRVEAARTCLRFVVVVDQFEELFTHDGDRAAALRFARALWEWATDPDANVCVVVTIRVDFLARCSEVVLEDSGLRLDKVASDPRHQVMVAQMAPDQLTAAIERPAVAAGIQLEEGLAQLVVRDVEAEPGALPLMSHALYLLWLRRADRVLTRAAYQSLGSVSGALNAHAEQVIAGLADDAARDAARRLLVRLIRPGDGGVADTRRRRPVEELRPSRAEDRERFDRALERLVSARLLMTSGGGDGAQAVEIAHEALIRSWARLRAWLDEERVKLARLDQLDQWAGDWRKNPDALLTGSRLAQGEEIAAQWGADLSDGGRALLEASRAEQRRLRAEARRAQRAKRAAVGAAFVALSGFTGFSWVQMKRTSDAERKSETTEARRKVSEGERQRAVTRATVTELRVRGETAEVGRAEVTEALALRSEHRRADVAGIDEVLFQFTATVRTRTPLQGMGEGGACLAGVLSADGARALTATEGGVVTVWAVPTGAPVAAIDTQGRAPTAMALSPDGARVAAATPDGALCLTAVATRERRCLPTLPRAAVAVAFSADGALVAATTGDRAVHVWEADGLAPRHPLALGWGEAKSLRFAPVGRRLLADAERATWVWDLDRPAPAFGRVTLQGTTSKVTTSAFSPDGALVVTGYADGTARTWDAASGAQRETLRGHVGEVTQAAFSVGDPLRVVTASRDGTARVWSARGGSQLCLLQSGAAPRSSSTRAPTRLPPAEAAVDSARFSPDGKRVLTTSRRGAATLWSATDGRALVSFGEAGSRVVDAWFAPGGDNLRLFVNAGDAASVWSTNDAALVQTRWGATARGPAGLSGDGRRMVSLASGTLALWHLDPARDDPPRIARADDGTSFATLTPDGAQVVVVDEQGRVRLRPWDADQATPLVADFGDALSAASPSPDGSRIVGGFRAGFVRFANRNPARPGGYGEPHSLGRHARQVNDIAFHPANPRVFVTASRDGAACLWALPAPGSPDAVEAPDGGCAARVARHSASVNTAAFSPDGALLVTASDDSTAGLWDVVHLRLVRYLRGHTDQVHSAAFSADGGRIVTASRDGTFRVWETATGRCLATLQGRMGPLVRAAFAAWGARSLLVTVSAAGTVRLWTLDGAQVERAARSFLGDAGSAPARDAGP